jgi:hypothetical protein
MTDWQPVMLGCWKRENYLEHEWLCFPAMLQGPCRWIQGRQYMKYLENLYGEPTHTMQEIPGVGHNATAIFSSKVGLQGLFDNNKRSIHWSMYVELPFSYK